MTALRAIPTFTFSPSVSAVPCEDVVDGSVVNSAQITPKDIHPDEVYEYAHRGLTTNGIGGKFGKDMRTIMFHFGKTIGRARADKALKLMATIEDRAEFVDAAEKALGGPDMRAVEILLRRTDPEPKEPQFVIAPVMSTIPILNFSVDDINQLELPS